MDAYDKCFNSLETHCVNMGATIKTLETQIGQLALAVQEQSVMTFPSDTEKNPRECKAVTLRSGKELGDNKKEQLKEGEVEKVNEDTTQVTEPIVVTPGNITFPDKPPKITHPLPYPQRFKKKIIDEQFSKFLSIFKKLQVNIPFADALEQMPHYAKFMKEIMTKKRKIEEQGMINSVVPSFRENYQKS